MNLPSNRANDRQSHLNPSGLLIALDLMELGIELKRQQLLRQSQGLSPEDLSRQLQNWISAVPETALLVSKE